MALAASDLPETVDLPGYGEYRIDPDTVDMELLERMNTAALDMAADTLTELAYRVISKPARSAVEAARYEMRAAHLMLAATLTRNGGM